MRGSLSKASTYLWAVLLGIFLLAVNQQSFGQDVNASLSGSVTDSSGAVIPGAKLTLVSENSGARLDFQTSADGEYKFPNLPPGIYDLSVTAPAFESFVRKGIELAVNQSARVDVPLTVGKADQTITVSADASLINYDNPTLGGGVSPETLQDFPAGDLRRSSLLSDGCHSYAWGHHRGRGQCLQLPYQRRDHYRRRSGGGWGDGVGRVHESVGDGELADRLWHVARYHERSQNPGLEL